MLYVVWFAGEQAEEEEMGRDVCMEARWVGVFLQWGATCLAIFVAAVVGCLHPGLAGTHIWVGGCVGAKTQPK